MSRNGNVVVGLDIGTTKVCTVIGEVASEGQVDIIGTGMSPSKGLRRGVVVNIENTVESIKKAIEEAELMAGMDIHSVFAGIAGSHIQSLNSRGIVAVSSRGKEITQADTRRAVDAAKAVAVSVDREILHILPQEYVVDDQDGIKEPIGMSGIKLEVDVHIVTGAVTSAQNVVKSVNRAGLEVRDIVLEQLASSAAVLNPDEQELGVLMIDIGGGTTDIAVFFEGSVWHTSVLSLGGDHVTKDVSIGFKTPTAEAERIKKKYGCACLNMVDPDETIKLAGIGGRKEKEVSRQTLCEIIEPRMEEIFSLVKKDVRNAGFEGVLSAGVVVTGGVAIMEGIPELAERVFDLPARRGVPTGVGGLIDVVSSPIYSTGVGLVLYGSNHGSQSRIIAGGSGKRLFYRVFSRMKEWFNEFW